MKMNIEATKIIRASKSSCTKYLLIITWIVVGSVFVRRFCLFLVFAHLRPPSIDWWFGFFHVPLSTELNYFTSSDPHHDMLGGGCQVRVVIENMMGRMENLRTLISGFLGLVILVRWALVTMFLS